MLHSSPHKLTYKVVVSPTPLGHTVTMKGTALSRQHAEAVAASMLFDGVGRVTTIDGVVYDNASGVELATSEASLHIADDDALVW